MEKTIIGVNGMTCNHCKMSVENALKRLEGVNSAEVSLENKNVTVEFDNSKISLDVLKETIDDTGFDVAD